MAVELSAAQGAAGRDAEPVLRGCGARGVCGRDRAVLAVVRSRRAGLAGGRGPARVVYDVAGACRAAGVGDRRCVGGCAGAFPRRVNAVLSAVRGMVVHAVTEGTAPGSLIRLLFEVAGDADLPEAARGEDGSTGWRVRARHRLREPGRPVDRASDADIVALLRGCCSARGRLMVLLMARAGLRRGEVAGPHRSDVHLLADSRELGCGVARAHLHVVRCPDNPNGAVAKSRRERAVPLDFLVVQAFDSYGGTPTAKASDNGTDAGAGPARLRRGGTGHLAA